MKRIGSLASILCVVLGSGVCSTYSAYGDVATITELVTEKNSDSVLGKLVLMLKEMIEKIYAYGVNLTDNIVEESEGEKILTRKITGYIEDEGWSMVKITKHEDDSADLELDKYVKDSGYGWANMRVTVSNDGEVRGYTDVYDNNRHAWRKFELRNEHRVEKDMDSLKLVEQLSSADKEKKLRFLPGVNGVTQMLAKYNV